MLMMTTNVIFLVCLLTIFLSMSFLSQASALSLAIGAVAPRSLREVTSLPAISGEHNLCLCLAHRIKWAWSEFFLLWLLPTVSADKNLSLCVMFVCLCLQSRDFVWGIFSLVCVCVCVYVFVFCDKFVGNIRWQQSQTCEGRPSEKEFRLCSGSELSSLTNYLVIEGRGSDRVFCECFFASSQNPESSQF